MRDPTGEGRSEDAATAVLETVPPVMRAIRGHMREGRPAGLSVPQFRALVYLRRHPGTGLSEIAEHLGTSLPAASELISRLVRQELVIRETDPRERRRVRLTLAPSGSAQLGEAEQRTTEWLRALLERLDPGRRRAVVEALGDLRSLLEEEGRPPQDPPDRGPAPPLTTPAGGNPWRPLRRRT